jgi:hypothetical protein
MAATTSRTLARTPMFLFAMVCLVLRPLYSGYWRGAGRNRTPPNVQSFCSKGKKSQKMKGLIVSACVRMRVSARSRQLLALLTPKSHSTMIHSSTCVLPRLATTATATTKTTKATTFDDIPCGESARLIVHGRIIGKCLDFQVKNNLCENGSRM